MTGPAVTVIIPAYNEAAVLPRTLDSLAAQDGIDEVQVVVVPNGCRDETAAVARSYADRFPRWTVLPVDRASKTNALNVGEAVAPPGPRIYLDADIELEPGLLRALLAALDTQAPLLVCPTVVYDTSASSAATRAFYDVFTRLPHVTQQMNGGLYGLTAAGRSRFSTFPDITADDTFVKRLFPPPDRCQLPETFVIQPPRDLCSLINIRTRIVRGNREVAALSDDTYRSTGASTAGELVGLVRREPRLLGKALLYAGVVTAARIRARRSGTHWERDDSSRGGAEPAPEAG